MIALQKASQIKETPIPDLAEVVATEVLTETTTQEQQAPQTRQQIVIPRAKSKPEVDETKTRKSSEDAKLEAISQLWKCRDIAEIHGLFNSEQLGWMTILDEAFGSINLSSVLEKFNGSYPLLMEELQKSYIHTGEIDIKSLANDVLITTGLRKKAPGAPIIKPKNNVVQISDYEDKLTTKHSISKRNGPTRGNVRYFG